MLIYQRKLSFPPITETLGWISFSSVLHEFYFGVHDNCRSKNYFCVINDIFFVNGFAV